MRRQETLCGGPVPVSSAKAASCVWPIAATPLLPPPGASRRRFPGSKLAYVRGQVLRRSSNPPRFPDHRPDRAGGRPAQPLYGRARDRDAAPDRLLPRDRVLHLPRVAGAPRRDRDLVDEGDGRLLRFGSADRDRTRPLLLARLAGIRTARVYRG